MSRSVPAGLFLALPLLFSPGGSVIAAAEGSAATPESIEAARLHQIFEDYFEESLDLNPILATSIGDPRYNDRLPNFLGPEAVAAQERFDRRWLERIRAIDRNRLSGQDRHSWDIFVWEREIALEGYRFPTHLLPIDQFTGLHSFFAQLGSGQSIQPFATTKDYRDFLRRADDAVTLLDQAIANMKEGMARGIVNPRPLMEKVIPQLSPHLVDDPEQSVFWGPIASFPETVPEADRAEITAAYRAVIADRIVPAYRRLHDFIRDEYLPACRTSVAVSALPDGAAWYAWLVRTQTTTDMSPEEIHAFGLSEVARITGEMEQVMKQVGFEGTLGEFFDHLEQDERHYFRDKDELLQGYRDLRTKIQALLPHAFDIFPKSDYEIREIPEFMAEASAGAFYRPGTPDGSRPGVFFINTFNLKAQPRYVMETLSIHEAAPGHHFQIAIAQEIEALPRFRRFGGTTAYFEGWALYAESIGRELGLFTDPYQYYGRLHDEMLRAMRLVVDTGMHSKGWTRDQAIRYMEDHSSMAPSEIVAEVERYIAIPGQALAYKVGQRVISDLRADAEKTLGASFDLKAFHRAVLIDGALPLGVLKTKMAEWLDRSKQEARRAGR